MDLSICEIEELKSRAETLLNELDVLLRKIGPDLEKIGRLQNELVVIREELESREENGE